jgi:hypothetical protein
MLPAKVAWGDVDSVKVWPLWGEPEKEMRVVIINKRPWDAVDVLIRVPKKDSFGDAAVTRLVAAGDKPLETRGPGGITFGGVNIGHGGVKKGSPAIDWVKRELNDDRDAWRVYMPPARRAGSGGCACMCVCVLRAAVCLLCINL